jgi:hypothetical protein
LRGGGSALPHSGHVRKLDLDVAVRFFALGAVVLGPPPRRKSKPASSPVGTRPPRLVLGPPTVARVAQRAQVVWVLAPTWRIAALQVGREGAPRLSVVGGVCARHPWV